MVVPGELDHDTVASCLGEEAGADLAVSEVIRLTAADDQPQVGDDGSRRPPQHTQARLRLPNVVEERGSDQVDPVGQPLGNRRCALQPVTLIGGGLGPEQIRLRVRAKPPRDEITLPRRQRPGEDDVEEAGGQMDQALVAQRSLDLQSTQRIDAGRA